MWDEILAIRNVVDDLTLSDSTIEKSNEFTQGASHVLHKLVSALRELIEHYPTPFANSADLAREAGIPKKLAWQIMRVCGSEEPMQSANFIPGQKSFLDFTRAMRQRIHRTDLIDKAEAAHIAYESFVSKFAGDRLSFISMLGESTRDQEEVSDADRAQRKAVFRAYSHFFGIQAKLSLDVTIIREINENIDTVVNLRTVSGLRRLRHDALNVLESHAVLPNAGDVTQWASMALDQDAYKLYGAPLVPAFCSTPIPKVSFKQESGGNHYVLRWCGEQVGIKSAVDITTANVTPEIQRPPRDGKQHGFLNRVTVGYPVETMVEYVLIHAPGRELLKPNLKLFLSTEPKNPNELRQSQECLIPREQIEFYPAGSWNSLPVDVASFRELVTYTLATMKWNPQDFAIYKMKMEYPLVNGTLLMELPWK